MSAVRSFVAAGIVGAVVWAFKREAERRQSEGQGAEPAIFKASLPSAPQGDVAGLFGDLFKLALNGVDDAPKAQATPLATVFSRQPSVQTGGGVRALLDMIGKHESRNSYEIVYSGSRISLPKRLTTMTVAEVRAWQEKSVKAGSKSSAVGYYQIIRATLDLLINNGTLNRSELFDRDAQDRAGVALLERRGLSSYQSGRMSAEQFAQNLAMEWASFPAITVDRSGRAASGQSYYAGDGLNKSLTSVSAVMNAVRAI